MRENKKALLEYAGVLDTFDESMLKKDVSSRVYTDAIRESVETIREIYRFRDSMKELKEDGITTLDIDTVLSEIENFGFIERKKNLSQYQREEEERWLGDVDTFLNVGSPREIEIAKFKSKTPIGTEINVNDLEELSKTKCKLCHNGIYTDVKDEHTLVITNYE
jgi:hypothetical protein